MEKRSTEKPYAKIIELTPDKEVPADRGGRIIDLNRALDSGRAPARPAPPRPAPEADTEAEPALTSTQEVRLRKQAEVDAEVDKAFGDVQPVENWLDADERQPAGDLPELPPITDIAAPAPAEPRPEPAEAPELPAAALAPEIEKVTAPEEIAASGQVEAPAETEELIDLTDVIQVDALPAEPTGGLEDDLIELTDIVEPQAVAASDDEEFIELADVVQTGAAAGEEEELIDLTDIVQTEEVPAEPSGHAGEDLIELVDVVAPPEPDQAPIELTDVVPAEAASQDEEEIIELTDIVPPEEVARLADAPQPHAAEPEAHIDALDLTELDRLLPSEDDLAQPPDAAAAEQVIKLAEHRKAEPAEPEIALAPEAEEFFEDLGETADDTLEMIGIELADSEPAARGLTPEAIEAAVEKILFTKYANRIEGLIALAVEKAVAREIEQIKREFMDEVDLREDDRDHP